MHSDGRSWGTPPALHSSKPEPDEASENAPIVSGAIRAVTVTESDYKTILLGYTIGSATLEDDGHVIVVASGNTLEFQVKRPGKKQRCFRANFTKLADAALRLYDDEAS